MSVPRAEPMPEVTRFFHPVLKAKRLGVAPVRVLLAGRAFALFRDSTGRPAALLDRCPHRFAPLSAGRVRPDGRLACPYHGWHFDAQGQGQSPSQPALLRCQVASFQVVERHGYLWLADREVPLSSFPTFDNQADGFEFAGTFEMAMPAPLHVTLDNFSEDEHTPFVHTRLGWDAAHTDHIAFEASNFPDRTEVYYQAPQRPTPLLRLLALRPGDIFHNRWVTRFDPVRTDYIISWTDTSGHPRPVVTKAVIFMVPETEQTTRFHVFAFVRIDDPRWRKLAPLVRQATRLLGWAEVRDDARFLPTVADTPLSMQGMRLGKYDKPLIHNRRLLRELYWGQCKLDP